MELFNRSILLGKLSDEWKMYQRQKRVIIQTLEINNRYLCSLFWTTYSRSVLVIFWSTILNQHIYFLHSYWGFTNERSTIGALLISTDHWLQLLEKGDDVSAVFFDYCKAFDLVPHTLLIRKLRNYNIHPCILFTPHLNQGSCLCGCTVNE